jgi:FtsH-binding integral membrane protein
VNETPPVPPPPTIPIWLIIGVTILVYGLAIAVTGIVRWNHPAPGVAMAQLHADFWWGLFMTALGLFYVIRFRPGRGR